MTTAELWARLDELDDQTVATITAAYGRLPSGDDSPEDLARLAAIVDAVTAGQVAARAMTAEEAAAPTLPEVVAPSTALLRQRIRNMDDAARQVFLGRWAASGLPQVLADGEGNDLILAAEEHAALENLIAQHEPPAPEHLDPFADLTPAQRAVTTGRLEAHGFTGITTTGRLTTLLTIVADIITETAAPVAAILGPVADGRIITTPVDDASDLALTPPAKGTVDELMAWVGDDPAKARRLLDQENVKAKPRKGLVAKLVPLAGSSSASPAAPDPAPAVEPVSEAPPQRIVEATAPAGAELFTSKPVAEWGPLDHAAFYGRLSSTLEKASRILPDLAAIVNTRSAA